LYWCSFIAVSQPNVIVETVKKAEDGHGMILRLYESQRKTCRVGIILPMKISAAWITDLLEENQIPLQLQDGGISLDLKPYQIVTLRVVL